jgi:hypothetical protein
MELWIRSQKKGTLIEVKDIRIMQLDKDGFRALIEEDATEGWNIVVNDDPCVGTYKTKERALEVLDEIENAILGIITDEEVKSQNVREYTGTAWASKVTNNIVYQMPEE